MSNKIQNIIINKIGNKDQEGLRILYSNYSGALFGIIMRIVKNKEVSEEVLQQTMLKIWNSIELYDSGKSTFYTWISTIARYTAIDKIRLKNFQKVQKSESLDQHEYNYKSVEIDNCKIDAQLLMDKLEDKYKIVLDKIYLEGYSHRDLAEELDIPIGTIKSRLRIALRKLREELKDEKKLFFGFLFFLIVILLLWH